jgi:esterase/lipase
MVNVILIHGMGGSTEGNVLSLENLLRPSYPEVNFTRLVAPHQDETLSAQEMNDRFVSEVSPLIPQGALVIGISMGGLLSLKLQSEIRPDIHVIGINAPTHRDEIDVRPKGPHLILYSTNDEVIEGRNQWMTIDPTHSIDLPWINHGLKGNLTAITSLIKKVLNQELLGHFPTNDFMRKEVSDLVLDNGAV